MIVAGVDVGNSTTEVCLGKWAQDGTLSFIGEAETRTTGTKGTTANVKGILEALTLALSKTPFTMKDLHSIRLNEAAPVIGDTAMETITETIVTGSTMIGHNPDTPAGEGLAVGVSARMQESIHEKTILIVDDNASYEAIANYINQHNAHIVGAILKNDEAVLVYNRLTVKVPIIDEVEQCHKIPSGMLTAIEVAPHGSNIRQLSNPYGIAKIFEIPPEELREIIPVAKSLIGIRSAVIIKTPRGAVKERVLPAGKLTIIGQDLQTFEVDLDEGAAKIMEMIEHVPHVLDFKGEKNTNIGNMFERIRQTMSQDEDEQQLPIKDVLAIDTYVENPVKGGLANEVALEKAIAIAAMVQAQRLPMEKLAKALENQTNIPVEVAGVEAVMAAIGAYTTPGAALPLVVLDLGGGSIDAAYLETNGQIHSVHLAGAGELITLLINQELGLQNRALSEDIKKYPLAKVQSFFHLHLENGDVRFFSEPLDSRLFGRTVIVTPEKLIPIETRYSMEHLVEVRQRIKEEVFIRNLLRALKSVAPSQDLRKLPNIVMVGGSALDFELPELLLKNLSKYKCVVGRGDIRGFCGPRNAVATGLVLSFRGAK